MPHHIESIVSEFATFYSSPIGAPLCPHLNHLYQSGYEMPALTDRLINLQYHPVLLFGPSGGGKTVLLQSLISSLKNLQGSSVNPSPGVELIPNEYEKATERIEDGRFFFSDEVPRFGRGDLPVKTQREYPFFCPRGLGLPKRFDQNYSIRLPGRNGRVV
jgi:hypothetical protein